LILMGFFSFLNISNKYLLFIEDVLCGHKWFSAV
jgi:hypothetical protein